MYICIYIYIYIYTYKGFGWGTTDVSNPPRNSLAGFVTSPAGRFRNLLSAFPCGAQLVRPGTYGTCSDGLTTRHHLFLHWSRAHRLRGRALHYLGTVWLDPARVCHRPDRVWLLHGLLVPLRLCDLACIRECAPSVESDPRRRPQRIAGNCGGEERLPGGPGFCIGRESFCSRQPS